MLRILRLILEFWAGVFAILLILLVLAVIRLNAKPFETTAFTPKLEKLIGHLLSGTKAHLDYSNLVWNNIDHTLTLHMQGLKAVNTHGETVGFNAADIKINAVDVVTGHFIPTFMTVDHPVIQMVRTDDGRFYMGGYLDDPSPKKVITAEDVQKRLHHLLSQLTRAGQVGSVEINNLEINITEKTDDGTMHSSLLARIPFIKLENTTEGLTGSAKLLTTEADKPSMDLKYKYNPSTEMQTINAYVEEFNPALYVPQFLPKADAVFGKTIDLPLTGGLQIDIDRKLTVQTINAAITGGQGILNYTAFWPMPRPVKAIELDGVYNGEARKLDGISVIDLGGSEVDINFSGTPSKLSARTMDVFFGMRLAQWPMDKFAELWPRAIVPNAYEWISKNVKKGQYFSAFGKFKGVLPLDDIDNLDVSEGSGEITAIGAQVTYLDGMPPAENVNALGKFDLKHMLINVTDGTVANIKILPFTIAITDLEKDMQKLEVPVNFTGRIPDVLALVDLPPFEYIKSMHMKPTDIQGTASAIADIKFPLSDNLQMTDVSVNVKGTLSGAAVPDLIPGIVLSKGEMTIDLDKNSVVLDGPLTINNLPMQGSYHHYFHPEDGKPIREGKVIGNFGESQWPDLIGDTFKGSHGSMTTTVKFVEKTENLFNLDGEADFTNTDLVVGMLNWKKPAGVPATLKTTIDISPGKPMNFKSLELRGPNTHVTGTALWDSVAGTLLKFDAPTFVVGRSNLTVHMTQTTGDNAQLTVSATGPALDVTGLASDKAAPHANPISQKFIIKVGRLYTGENNYIGQAEGFATRSAIGWENMDLKGQAQGDHPMSLQLLPQSDGTRSLKIFCDDFGVLLQSFAVTNTIKGGAVDVQGESTHEDPQTVKGRVKIGKFVVSDLPLLAVLINAISPFGFADVLNRTATFDKMTGKFAWSGDKIELLKINAAGASVGINTDGIVDMKNDKADLHGTLVPFSIINRAIDAIPLIGDMITGGKGQGVLAIAYNVKGPLSSPSINVNPISLLTPGFIRNLFFDNSVGGENIPDDKSDAPETAAPVAAPPVNVPGVTPTDSKAGSDAN